MRHDAHYVEELEARTLPIAVPQAKIPTRETAGRRLGTLVAGAMVAAIIGATGIWSLRSGTGQISQPRPTASAPDSTTSGLGTLPTPAPSPAAASSIALPAPSAAAPTFAVQMATFRSQARATESIRELGAAGYTAFSAEIGLRDGERAFGVFLGPYTERAAAAADLERAQLTPGYGIGRVVQISLAR
jgi:cell division septation protein DedD